MDRGLDVPISDARILNALGHGKTKLVARATGCTYRQARRMLHRGRIPRALREAVLRLARKQLDLQLARIQAAKDALLILENEERLAAIEDRGAQLRGRPMA